MPTAKTGEELLELVRHSGAVDSDKLRQVMATHPDAPQIAQPRQLAGLLVQQQLLTRFQAEELLRGRPQTFLIGGKYRVLDLLGSGGMGRVYLCEHLRMRRLVAVKLLPEESLLIPGALERFEREARAVALLKHRNIAEAYDIDQDGDTHFLVMEFIDGRSLEDVVAISGPLDIARATSYISQAAQGLQYAFQTAGLIHRDIKPGNLLLERSGTVKILDLGLARFLFDKSDKLTSRYDQNSVLGTADYLSPEQADNSHAVDIRADIYSLGATLYTLLTGGRPFGEGSVAQKLLWVQLKDPRPLRSVRPEIPQGLEAVVRKMMAKAREERYSSPAEVIDALAPFVPTPVAAPPAPEWMPPPFPGKLYSLELMTGDAPTGSHRPVHNVAGVSASPVMEPPAETLIDATRRLPKSQAKPLAGSRLWGLVSVAVVVAVLVVTAVQFWPTPQQDDKPKGPRLPTTLLVDDTGEQGRYPSIRAAIKASIKGDRIIVRVPHWEETLNLGPVDLPGGDVTIEGRILSGELVRWSPGAGHLADKPLLEVSNISSLRLTGFHLDGKGQCENLVRLAGACPGLSLERLKLQGFDNAAIVTADLVGDPTPIRLAGLHFLCGKGTKALHLTSMAGGVNRFLEVRDCRFDGPGNAVVQVGAECGDIQLRHNRMSGFRAGVAYPKVARLPRAHLRLVGNTAYAMEAFLNLEAIPPTQNYGPWEVENNLLIQVKRIADVVGDVGPGGFLPTRPRNGCDQADGVGAQLLGCVVVPVSDVELRPDNDRLYLRYPSTSPLMKAGSGGTPLGVPPLAQ